MAHISRNEYLDKNFDYSKLTKQELRYIMSENNVQDIPPLTSLKQAIMDAYKTSIHDRIDELKGNFSNENIFQSSSNRDSSEEIDDNDVKQNSFISNRSSMLVNESEKSFMGAANKSMDYSRSSIFTDSPSAGLKMRKSLKSPIKNQCKVQIGLNKADDLIKASPKVVLSKSNASFTESEKDDLSIVSSDNFKIKEKSLISSIEKVRTSKRFKFSVIKNLLLVISVSLIVYLRFFCPYCGTGAKFCIPLPRNTYLDANGKLQADRGYKIVNSVITHCVIDNHELTEKNKKVFKIIRMLEYIKGGQDFGYGAFTKIKLDDLTDDKAIKDALAGREEVVIQNGFIRARKGRVSIRVFLRYYVFKLSRIIIPALLVLLLIKYILYRRNKKQLLNKQAFAIARDVLDILIRQLIASSKSSVFKPYVYEIQLREALEIKDYLWRVVKDIVEKNSNVSSVVDESCKTRWEWIGPIIQRDAALEK